MLFQPQTANFEFTVDTKDIDEGYRTILVKAYDTSDSMVTQQVKVWVGHRIHIANISGGIGVSAVIRNPGISDISHVEWSIDIRGLVVIGRHTEGTISVLKPGESVEVNNSLVFGIGPATITVTAGGASKQVQCFVFGPFIFRVR